MANVFAAVSEDQMTANLLISWTRADATCRAHGTNWYRDANRLARELAGASGLTLERTSALLAVLSPRSSWSTNKRNAAVLLMEAGLLDWERAVEILRASGSEPRDGVWRLHEAVGLPGNIAKARAIIAGEPIPKMGPKTRAFWSNIKDPVHSAAVTIDAWFAGAAVGRRLSSAEMGGLTERHYQRIANAARHCAAVLRIKAHIFQATVWCEVRGQTGWSAAHNS